MSRTFRRKNLSKLAAMSLAAIAPENHVIHFRRCFKEPELLWAAWGFSSHKDYVEARLRDFYSDYCKHYVNYHNAPKSYRKMKEQIFRTAHKQEMHRVFKECLAEPSGQDDSVQLRPFKHDAGWDYW